MPESAYQQFVMELTTTSKGKPKLCFNGYTYTKKIAKKDWIRWQCTHERTGCKGALTTDSLVVGNPRSFIEHSHDPDPCEAEVAKFKSTITQAAKTTAGVKPSTILTNALLNVSEEAKAKIGKCDSIKRHIRKQQSARRPPEPATLADLDIADPWTTTGGENPRQFLIYDNGGGDRDRIVVFASNTGLRHLARSQTWYMDGNFALSPNIFKQLYVIRAPIGETAVSCVYAFLQGASGPSQELVHAAAKC